MDKIYQEKFTFDGWVDHDRRRLVITIVRDIGPQRQSMKVSFAIDEVPWANWHAGTTVPCVDYMEGRDFALLKMVCPECGKKTDPAKESKVSGR